MLIEQVADRQVFGKIADGHGRDDFLAVQENRQGPLDRYGGLDPYASLVDAGHTLRQSRIVGVGPDDVIVSIFAHCSIIADILPQHENCPTKVGSGPRFVHASWHQITKIVSKLRGMDID